MIVRFDDARVFDLPGIRIMDARRRLAGRPGR
jgi:hypothetical protein